MRIMLPSNLSLYCVAEVSVAKLENTVMKEHERQYSSAAKKCTVS